MVVGSEAKEGVSSKAVPDSNDNPPFALYQCADLDFSTTSLSQSQTITGSTTLWIGYKNSIIAGAVLNLHCRQCDIKQVFVNSVAAEFKITDALQNLSQKQSFSSEEIDLNYRAALEVARSGELQVIIPQLSSNSIARTTPPRTIPRHCSKEVQERFKNIVSLYRNLTEIRDYGNDNDLDVDGDGESTAKPCYMLQVQIEYRLDKPDTGKFSSGYIVRNKPSFASIFAKTVPVPRGEHVVQHSASSLCAYSTVSQSEQYSGRDIDGVRCWLPCIDALDQRLVFDISLKTPRKCSVLCSGERVSTMKVPRSEVFPLPMKITRFFTPTRIAAGSIGYFIGSVESYNMPLYKVNGKFWVTTGFRDFTLAPEKTPRKKLDTSGAGNSPRSSKKVEKVSISKKRAFSSTADAAVVDLSTAVPSTMRNPSSADPVAVSEPVQSDGTVAVKDISLNPDNDAEERETKRQRMNSIDAITEYDVDKILNVSNIYAPLEEDSKEVTQIPVVQQANTTTTADVVKDSASHDTEGKRNQKLTRNIRPHPEPHDSGDEDDHAFDDPDADAEMARAPSKLYAAMVNHSSLGLDMAIRRLHKYVEKKFSYTHFTFVYVHDLGCDFMSFDGFALINAKFLSKSDDVYLESSAHLILITAYLYSWMKSSLPLSSYESKFILHGVVGYLLNAYVEEVFGEEECKYRYQKQYDTIIELEKQGVAMPLFTFFPEYYEIFTLDYGEYVKCKSTILFHLIESHIGGKEPLRAVLRQLIRSPPLHASKGGSNLLGGHPSSGEQSPSIGSVTSPTRFFTKVLQQDENTSNSGGDISPQMQPYSSVRYGLGGTTPYGGHVSPYYNAGNTSVVGPYAGGQTPYSPYYGGNASPHLSAHYTAGEMSPYYNYNADVSKSAYYSPSHAFSASPLMVPTFHGGNSTDLASHPMMTSLYRQSSISSETGWGRDFSALCNDNISAEGLVLTCRYASGANSDIDESFLSKFVYNSVGCSIVARIDVTITQKVENKPRQIIVHYDRVGVMQCHDIFCIPKNDYELQLLWPAPSPPCDLVKLRLAEVKDDVVTEPILTLNADRKGIYQQQAFSRPGRQKGRSKRRPGDGDHAMLSAEQQEELARRERDKEDRMPILQFVRDVLDHPIRFAVMDPQTLEIISVHNASSDALLIEQLFADVGENNMSMHISALRSIARAVVTSAGIMQPGVDVDNLDPGSSMRGMPLRSDRSAKLHIKALTTCLMDSPALSPTTVDASCISNGHHYFVRAEAAYALAKWQNLNAPKLLSSASSVTTAEISVNGTASWHAMNALIDCLQDLFMFEDSASDSHLPLPSDFTNESDIYLRNAILLALSTIRSQSGHTPIRVIDLLLKFYNFSCDSSEINGQPESDGVPSFLNDIHYRSTLLLAFSRISFENISSFSYSKTTPSSSSHSSPSLVREVIDICLDVIDSAYTEARANARIDYMRLAVVDEAFSRSHTLPTLKCEGIDVAAALTCLVEIDIQATVISSAPTASSLSRGSSDGDIPTERDRVVIGVSVTPTGVGLASGFNYLKCILDPSVSLPCVRCVHTGVSQSQKGQKTHASMRDESFFFLCTPLVRVAAFEAFARLCFAQHSSHESRFQAMHGGIKKTPGPAEPGSNGPPASAPPKLPESTFIAAIFEVLFLVLKYDPNQWVRQQCARALLDAVQDRRARTVSQELSLSNPLLCMDWHDTAALTSWSTSIISSFRRGMHTTARHHGDWHKAAMKSSVGNHMRVALKLFWRWIVSSAHGDQVIRSTLLSTWIYCFGTSTPRVLAKLDDKSSNSSILEANSLREVLRSDRFKLRNPFDLLQEFETAMRYGLEHSSSRPDRAAPARSQRAEGPGGGGGGGGGSVVVGVEKIRLDTSESTGDGDGSSLRLSLMRNRVGPKNPSTSLPLNTEQESSSKALKLVFKQVDNHLGGGPRQ